MSKDDQTEDQLIIGTELATRRRAEAVSRALRKLHAATTFEQEYPNADVWKQVRVGSSGAHDVEVIPPTASLHQGKKLVISAKVLHTQGKTVKAIRLGTAARPIRVLSPVAPQASGMSAKPGATPLPNQSLSLEQRNEAAIAMLQRWAREDFNDEPAAVPPFSLGVTD